MYNEEPLYTLFESLKAHFVLEFCFRAKIKTKFAVFQPNFSHILTQGWYQNRVKWNFGHSWGPVLALFTASIWLRDSKNDN